jgi:glycine/D-amino acid oxidase-like deaminating enzyme
VNTTVICGAGIAGIATAHYLKKLGSTDRIVLVDRSQPLSFTTAASGENFRDYWPQRCMQDFVSHSLKLIRELDEDCETLFSFKQSGYEFVSEDESRDIFPADDIPEDDSARAIHRILSPCLHATRPYLGINIKQVTQIV